MIGSSWKTTSKLLRRSIAVASESPSFLWSHISLAWHLATANNLAERNSKDAVKFAHKACELDGFHYWRFLVALAASYAENGQYDEAVKWQTKAIANCPKDETQMDDIVLIPKGCRLQGEPMNMTQMRYVLERYQNHKSYGYS